ncbi:MAG: DedA family protein [Micromonosporaceae bacterium]
MSIGIAALGISASLTPEWLDPDFLIRTGGFWGLLAIVFAESAVLFGIILPGDSLLFTAGLLSATTDWMPALWVLLICVPAAAIAGDQTGYWIGRKAGPAIFRRPDSLIFKQQYVEKSHDFFEKYGPRTVAMARFVPIVRTLAPIMAGASKMRYRTFTIYNTCGDIAWGMGVTTLGYFLGQISFVREYIELMLILIVFLSVLPMLIHLLQAWLSSRRAKAGLSTEPPGANSPADVSTHHR